jgi:hypothetical protein
MPPSVEAVGAGSRAAPNVPDEILPAFVVSVEQEGDALERSPHVGCAPVDEPSVLIEIRKLCITAAWLRTPPTAEMAGNGSAAAGTEPHVGSALAPAPTNT